MKTLRPIKITASIKDGLFNSAKRAINNAYCNNIIVQLVIDGIDCLVYPNDDAIKVIEHIKTLILEKKISQLKSALGV